MTAFKSMMKYLFKYEDDGSAPNLSGKFEVFADRGYWGQEMLRYLISKGALNQFLYNYGKKKSTTSAKSSEKLESIFIDSTLQIFQTTAKHNLGKSSTKDHELTATAFRNGYSKSDFSMTISLDPQYTNLVDFTISSAKHTKIYFKEKTKNEEIMSAFCLIAGSDPYNSEEDEDDEFLRSHWVVLTCFVIPITMLQGDQSWFIMRCFALTSSIMDRVIRAKSLYTYMFHEVRSSFQSVLEYVGLAYLLPQHDDHAGQTNDEGMSVDEESHESHISIVDETVEEVSKGELIPRNVDGDKANTNVYLLPAPK